MKINRTKIIETLKSLVILGLIFLSIINVLFMKRKNLEIEALQKQDEERYENLVECYKGRTQYEEQISLLQRIINRN